MTAELIPYSGKALNRLIGRYVGKIYGKVTIIEIAGKKGKGHVMVKILCDCGRVGVVDINDIKRLHTKSCGCLTIGKNVNKSGRFKYGTVLAVKQPENKAWAHIKQLAREYEITICERWLGRRTGYANFLKDMGRRPSPAHKLVRVSFSKGYNKDNCRWLPPKKERIGESVTRVFKGAKIEGDIKDD
jgi:hypothetical protein